MQYMPRMSSTLDCNHVVFAEMVEWINVFNTVGLPLFTNDRINTGAIHRLLTSNRINP